MCESWLVVILVLDNTYCCVLGINIGHDIVMIMSNYVCTPHILRFFRYILEQELNSFCISSTRGWARSLERASFPEFVQKSPPYSCPYRCGSGQEAKSLCQKSLIESFANNMLRFSWLTERFSPSSEGTDQYTLQCTLLTASYIWGQRW